MVTYFSKPSFVLDLTSENWTVHAIEKFNIIHPISGWGDESVIKVAATSRRSRLQIPATRVNLRWTRQPTKNSSLRRGRWDLWSKMAILSSSGFD